MFSTAHKHEFKANVIATLLITFLLVVIALLSIQPIRAQMINGAIIYPSDLPWCPTDQAPLTITPMPPAPGVDGTVYTCRGRVTVREFESGEIEKLRIFPSIIQTSPQKPSSSVTPSS
jgi:hypothetical protein